MTLRYVQGLALVCALVGLGVFVYKSAALGIPLRADASRSAWTIEASMRFEARPGPIKASLRVPARP